MNKRTTGAAGPKSHVLSDAANWVPVLFLLFVFLTGGASRSDVTSLPVLRGASVLFACWATMGLCREDWRRIRVPLGLLLALTAWIALQLVPLPPSLWQGLPGRELVVAADRLLGQPDIWRPLSLTPAETWNSLLAMTVPLAALLLGGRLGAEDMARMMQVLVIIAIASGLLGVFQIISDAGSGAYLYRITNADAMVGLFANRNHHAVFQACSVLFAATLLRDEWLRRRRRPMLQIGYAAAFVLCTTLTLLIGSRAGLIAGGAAFMIGYAMLVPAWRARPVARHRAEPPVPPAAGSQWLTYVPLVLFAALVVTIIVLADRSTSLSRLAENRAADDLRVLAWPTVRQMVETYWATGGGFGSFPGLYQIFEPDSLLQPAYFNHAHNDWAEALITGGLPFLLIIAAALVWFGRAVARIGLQRLIGATRGDYRLPILAMVGMLAASSAVEYPLRTPSLQAMAVLLLALFACPGPATAQRE